MSLITPVGHDDVDDVVRAHIAQQHVAYAHIADGGYNVGVGQSVGAGQVIAYVGNTGASSGCHLHFEVWIGADRIDPAPFLRARGISV